MSYRIPNFRLSEDFSKHDFPDIEDTTTYTARLKEEHNYDNFDNMQLVPIVGSANRRHVYRKNAFKNKFAFNEWQNDIRKEDPHDPRLNLTGEDMLVDGDDIPEFVVKRGNRVVAVNGYSTKKSDYPIEYKYYEANPSKSQRETMPMKHWLMTHYKDNFHLNPDTGLPSDEYYEWRTKEIKTHKDDRRIPMLTPSNIFKNVFVYSQYQNAIDAAVEAVYPKSKYDKKQRDASLW